MLVRLRMFWWCLSLCVACVSASAHKPSDSYLTITGGATVSAKWDIALKDLEMLVGLDLDQNGQITWGELKSQRNAVEAHAMSHLRIDADGEPCEIKVDDLMVTQHSDGAYAVLLLTIGSPSGAEVYNVHYSLLFDDDPTHRGLVVYRDGEETSTHIITPDEPTLELRPGKTSMLLAFLDFVREGVWHIWIGLDHVLFLLTLLLPAVLIRREKKWEPVASFRQASRAVLKIVTVFTLAHSITLWLAVMEYVTLPGRWVESVIAFSIIVTAVNNLFPVLPLAGWAIAFGFGLVHGFGFANVLQDLGLTSGSLGVALFGFNVGVELGQIAIVLVFLPFAYLMRNTTFYRTWVLRGGSVLIAVLAALWMVERIFNMVIVGF